MGLGERGRGLGEHLQLEAQLRFLVLVAGGAWRSRLLVFLSARPVTRTSAAVPRGYWRARAGAAARDHRAMVATSGVAKS